MRFFLSLFCIVLSSYVFAQSGTFTEVHQIKCGESMSISPLGYPTWNDPKILRSAYYGDSKLIGDLVPANILIYTAPPYFTGSDTVIIQCAHATQITCDTGIYIFQITCDTSAPDQQVFVFDAPCQDTMIIENLSAWQIPQLHTAPQYGSAKVYTTPTDGAGLIYTAPNVPGFVGTEWVTVSGINGQIYLYVFHIDCTTIGTAPEALPQASITASPNPATDYLALDTQFELREILIYDLLGRLHISTNQPRIEIADLPQGRYLLSVKTGVGVWKGWFVKG